MKKQIMVAAAFCSVWMYSFITNDTTTPTTSDEIVSTSSSLAPEKFMIDPKKSKIEWLGKGVGKQHVGTINISTGSLTVDTKQITSIYSYIDMKTIKCADIKDEGFNKQLCDHLKSADLFHIAKYPSAIFKMTKATRLDVPDGQVNYNIEGKLTMHGVEKAVTFPATVLFGKKKITVNAALKIDRTQWNIKYNSGNYFKDLGDKLIEDEIELKLMIEGNV